MTAHSTWAIVPVKPFRKAKLRLSSVLDTEQRERLTVAMLDDLLSTLQSTPEVDALCVISDEPALHDRSRSYHLLRDPVKGSLSDVVNTATEFAIRHGATACCVLHADLPLASGGPVSRLLQEHRARGASGVTLVPDRKRTGTNVMIRTPANVIGCRYGDASLAAHRSAAVDLGIPVEVVTDDALSLDIDHAGDLQSLCEAYRLNPGATGPRTASFLARLLSADSASNDRQTPRRSA